MENILAIFAESIAIFFAGVILATLFIWNIIQGVLIQFSSSGANISPLIYYFSAWLSGVAAVWLYFKATQLFHYAKISR